MVVSTDAELKRAESQRGFLLKRQNSLENRKVVLERRTEQSNQKIERLVARREETPFAFFGSALSTAAAAPIDLTSSTIGFLTQPKKEFKEIKKGISDLPSAFATQPLTTFGALAGGAVADTIIFTGLTRALARTKIITKTGTRRVRVSQSYSVSDVRFVGTDIVGSKQFSVKTKVVTKVVDAKSGKTVDFIGTDVDTLVVTAQSETGAIRSAAQSISASLRRGGQRVFLSEPKITQKFSVNKAEGQAFFKVVDGKRFVGELESTVTDFGEFRIKATREGATGKIREFKAKPQSTALTNINSILLGKRSAVRSKGIVSVLGKEDIVLSKTLTSLFPETLRVKGFVKAGKRVPPKTRKFPRTVKGGEVRLERFDPSLDLNLATVFFPKEVVIDFGGASVRKARPKTARPSTARPSGELQQIQLDRTIAQLIGSQQARQVGSVIKKKAETPKKITPSITQSSKQLERLTQTVSPSVAFGQTTKQSQQQQAKQKNALANLSKVLGGTAQISSPSLSHTNLLGQIQGTGQIQQLQLKQLSAFDSPAVPTAVSTFEFPSPKSITSTPGRTTPIPFTLNLTKQLRKITEPTEKGYNVFVKDRGKFRKTNLVPLTRPFALSQGAFFSDNTTSRQFKIKKTKQLAQPPKRRIPPNYYLANFFKFRQFQQRRGRRTRIKNRFIERSRFGIDTSGEIRGLRLAKALSQTRPRRSRAFNIAGTSKKLNRMLGI